MWKTFGLSHRDTRRAVHQLSCDFRARQLRYVAVMPKPKPIRIPMDFDASLALAMKVKPPVKTKTAKAGKKKQAR